MKITKIECTNYKSFKKFEVKLTDFNVIIGTNGAGKSNFISIFKFIRDMISDDLETAIKNQGGNDFLKNFFINSESDIFTLKFTLYTANELSTDIILSKKSTKLNIYKLFVDIEIMLLPNGSFKISNENVKICFDYYDDKIKIGSSDLMIKRQKDNKLSFDLLNFESTDYEISSVFKNFTKIKNEELKEKELAVEFALSNLFNIDKKKSILPEISIYEFEQDLLSSFRHQSDKDDESREIFMLLLKEVLSDDNKRREFFNLLNFILPDIDDVKFDAGLSNLFLVKERFNNRYIPANFLSDGTIFLIVIILSLYFDNKYLTIFDEPERRIHPHIISKVVDMMKDVSGKKQIILSTHNAEIVKYSGLESILLVHRDSEGFSTISKPQEKDEINIFIMNEIGLDELFVQNMLLI